MFERRPWLRLRDVSKCDTWWEDLHSVQVELHICAIKHVPKAEEHMSISPKYIVTFRIWMKRVGVIIEVNMAMNTQKIVQHPHFSLRNVFFMYTCGFLIHDDHLY